MFFQWVETLNGLGNKIMEKIGYPISMDKHPDQQYRNNLAKELKDTRKERHKLLQNAETKKKKSA